MKSNMEMTVSHEWIYQYIYKDKQAGGSLHLHLRCMKKRKKRYGTNDARGIIKNRVNIDERPAVVDTRSRLGDWEFNTIIGKRHKQAIVSLTERKSRMSLIYKVERKTKDNVTDAIINIHTLIKNSVHTRTSDNGKEFANHETIANHLDADFYFAHPYVSYERGLNENTNGLIRQYFPQNRNFSTITNDEIIMAIKKLNNRPRKCHGFKTPNQVFFMNELNNVALTI